MTMTGRTQLLCFMLLALAGCGDTPVGPASETAPQFAKGGGSGGGGSRTTTQHLNFDFGAVDALHDDGGGTYVDGFCGTVGLWSDIVFLGPAGGSIPKSQTTFCADKMRSARITLDLLHGSPDPADHSADAPSDGGTWGVGNVKFGAHGGVVNMYGPCNSVDRRGNWGGTGLRWNSESYPGSNNLVQEDLGGGAHRFFTEAYPDNLAYCQDVDGNVSYWHVALDVTLQIVG